MTNSTGKQWLRCRYIEPNGHQCDSWYLFVDEDHKLCAEHAGILPTNNTPIPDNNSKSEYITLLNEQRLYCYQMTDDQLEEHIARIDAEIAIWKAKGLTARAIKTERFEKMTEEELAERRKFVINRAVETSERKTAKQVKPSLKSDPIAYFRSQYPMMASKTDDEILEMMGLKKEEVKK
jgi:hypothetical protein